MDTSSFRFPPGEWELSVSHPAYRLLSHHLEVSDQSLELELRLEWVTSVEDSITVIGIRAGEQVPVTKRNMDRDEIDKFSYGQGCSAAARSYSIDELVLRLGYRVQLLVLQHARDPTDPHQHDPRRSAAQTIPRNTLCSSTISTTF